VALCCVSFLLCIAIKANVLSGITMCISVMANMLSDILLSVTIKLNMLSGVMLCVVKLSVMSPPTLLERVCLCKDNI